jgi:dihydrolipoamide dehydrogenase
VAQPNTDSAPNPSASAYDLIVIGSGPGGYVAAIRAAQLGLRTAVVEKDPFLGGTCLHRGCIPTKAWLHSAHLLDEIREAEYFGILVGEPSYDLGKVHGYKRGVVQKNAKGIEFLFRKNKIDFLRGFGRVAGANQVAVEQGGESKVYETRFILIATGSVPRDIAVAPADGQRILNSDHALELEQLPASIAVLGAGAVGSEFASIFRSFGVDVTLIEMLPRILPIEDEDASAEVERAFRKRGIKVLKGAKLDSVERIPTGVRLVVFQNGETKLVEADALLVAVGRAPVTAGLGLEALGVELERGYVKVDAHMRSAVPSIFAIGDVVQTPWLAHVASAEGILAVETMAGYAGARPLDYDLVPSCTYCQPEVASVGLTEAKARELGYEVQVGKFPFSALAKAAILKSTEGFVKVVRGTKYDEVLGVHIVGPHATDLIAEACVAIGLETTTEELVRTIHAHPTLSEAVAEAAHAAMGHAIHI